MNTPPRSNRAEEGEGFASPRLTLHIPNSYPRNISPHGSPKIGSPSVRSINLPIGKDSPKSKDENQNSLGILPSSHRLQSSISAPGALSGNGDEDLLPAFAENDNRTNLIQSIQWTTSFKQFFKGNRTTAESARDFLARERTFFSWLRLSSMMAIGSAALFLRLQLRNLNQVIDQKPHGLNVDGGEMDKMEHESAFIQALRAQAMRKIVVQNQNVLARSSLTIPSSTSTPPHTSLDHQRNVLDTSVALSEALGILFFVLAIFSLIIGWIDYMRCVNALEHADEVVPILANQDTSNTDDGHPNNLERRAIAQKYHDARHARQAHSTRIVYFTELIVAFFIFATALIILLTNNKASIAPELPTLIGKTS